MAIDWEFIERIEPIISSDASIASAVSVIYAAYRATQGIKDWEKA